MGRALIIGGGIAGTVTAIALKKAGWEPVVYEAYERTADGVGGGLGVGVNGLAALESIGRLRTRPCAEASRSSTASAAPMRNAPLQACARSLPTAATSGATCWSVRMDRTHGAAGSSTRRHQPPGTSRSCKSMDRSAGC